MYSIKYSPIYICHRFFDLYIRIKISEANGFYEGSKGCPITTLDRNLYNTAATPCSSSFSTQCYKVGEKSTILKAIFLDNFSSPSWSSH